MYIICICICIRNQTNTYAFVSKIILCMYLLYGNTRSPGFVGETNGLCQSPSFLDCRLWVQDWHESNQYLPRSTAKTESTHARHKVLQLEDLVSALEIIVDLKTTHENEIQE